MYLCGNMWMAMAMADDVKKQPPTFLSDVEHQKDCVVALTGRATHVLKDKNPIDLAAAWSTIINPQSCAADESTMPVISSLYDRISRIGNGVDIDDVKLELSHWGKNCSRTTELNSIDIAIR